MINLFDYKLCFDTAYNCNNCYYNKIEVIHNNKNTLTNKVENNLFKCNNKIENDNFKNNKNHIIENKIIIIGGNHHNMLGVIRMLGEKGIKPYIIVTNDNKYAFVIKSRYVKDYDIVLENEKEIEKILMEKYANKQNKAILIPTSDFAALFIDKNLNKLKKYFIVPNINDDQGKIEELMNKYNQYQLAKKYKINMAKTLKIDLTKKINIKEMPFPCILKPIVSALGKKGDIEICQNEDELKESIKRLKDKNYKEILLQEKINYDYECGIKGCIYNRKVIMPGITKIIRSYPQKRGTNSFGLISPYNFENIDINNFINMLKDLNYNGIFDSEIFIKDKKVYLNEINCRTSGCGYSLIYGGVNLPFLWVSLINKEDISNEKLKIEKEYYFQDEILDLQSLIHKEINFKEYMKSFIKAKTHLILNKHDLKPFVYKYLYAILRRIKK